MQLLAIRQLNIFFAPVAQLDRVFGYEPKGRGFESLQARHLLPSRKYFYMEVFSPFGFSPLAKRRVSCLLLGRVSRRAIKKVSFVEAFFIMPVRDATASLLPSRKTQGVLPFARQSVFFHLRQFVRLI